MCNWGTVSMSFSTIAMASAQAKLRRGPWQTQGKKRDATWESQQQHVPFPRKSLEIL